MKILKSLLCRIIGHKAIKPIVDSEFSKIYTPVYVYPHVTKTTSLANMIYPPQHTITSTYYIFTIPDKSACNVCSRCDRIFWRNDNSDGDICDLSNIPGLEHLYELHKRVEWEKQQREVNLAADRLYQQYLMVLKLSV